MSIAEQKNANEAEKVKKCPRCGETKCVSAFYREIKRYDGRQKYCIDCRRLMKGIVAREAEKAAKKAAQEAEDEAKDARIKETWERIRNPMDDAWKERIEAAAKWREEQKKVARREWEKERRRINPASFAAKNKRWIERNPEKAKQIRRQYAKNNRESEAAKKRKWVKSKKACPLFQIAKRIRATTRKAFKVKKIKKKNLTIEMLGCSFEVFKAHLQKQFTKGMGWHNMSKWHIDHIVPLASAKTESELIALAHFSNLRPMWAADNMSKHAKIVTCQPELTLSIR